MKQPDSLDIGTKMDVVRHRLNVAKEDLESAYLTFRQDSSGQQIIVHITASFIQSVQFLLKKALHLKNIRIHSVILTRIMFNPR